MLVKNENITTIQYLRGIAALMVVGCHVVPQIERMGYSGSKLHALQAGVDIFFVISGFIMWHTAGKFESTTPLNFAWRRVARIVPLYWILSAFILTVALIAPRLLQSTSADPLYVLKSFLFIPALDSDSGQYYPLLNPGWTLNYEMFFYAIFAVALLTRDLRIRVGSILLALTGLTLVGLIARPTGVLGFYTNSVVFEFAIGILLALAKSAGRLRASAPLGWTMLALGFILLAGTEVTHFDLPRVVEYGLPAALVVGGGLLLPATEEGVIRRALHKLGDSSYSLYLSHAIVMSACGQLWRRAGLSDLPFTLFGLVATTICIIGGFATFYILERPLTKAVRKIDRLIKAPAAA